MQRIIRTTQADRIGYVNRGVKIHIFVQDVGVGAAVYISKQRSILENPVAAQQGGMQITNGLGPIELNWEGDLWIIGANPTNPNGVPIDISTE